MEQQEQKQQQATAALKDLSLGSKEHQQQDEPPAAATPGVEATEEEEEEEEAAALTTSAPSLDGACDVEDAKGQLINTLTEELLKCKAELERISKEREYFKRRAEWATTSDPKILSPVLTSADAWHDRTWLMLHEPIRQALLDFEDLVMTAPSFDPVKQPWKVTNFFYYWKGAFAPYVRRHHDAEEGVYIPWIKTKAEIPAAVTESHGGLEQLLKAVEQSEPAYKALVKAKAAAEALNEWRATLITRLRAVSDALQAHMDEEERFFPRIVSLHFTQKEEQATLEKMGSAGSAHIELPMVVLGMDVWATPTIKDAFIAQLSAPARYTLNSYWLSTFKKTLARALESLALEEPPPPTYMPLMSAPTLLVAAPAFLLCSIQ